MSKTTFEVGEDGGTLDWESHVTKMQDGRVTVEFTAGASCFTITMTPDQVKEHYNELLEVVEF